MKELLTSHQPTEKEIMFPELYKKDRVKEIDKFKNLKNIMSKLSTEEIESNRISIISFKRYISAFTFLLSPGVKDNYLRAFSDGLRMKNSKSICSVNHVPPQNGFFKFW